MTLRSLLVACGLLFVAVEVRAQSPASTPAPSSDPPVPADAAHCGTADRIGGQLPYEQLNVSGGLERVTDSEIGPEGAAWDAPIAVTITGSGSITYDFGQAETLRALYLQADANDTYRVSGSIDGKIFRPVTEFPSAFSRGHGLRSRAIQIEPTSLRYLRLSTGVGDGAFSISEFAVFCEVPNPFPPALRSTTAPLAQNADQAATAETADDESTGRTALLALAGLLAFVGAVRFGKGARKETSDEGEDDEDDEDAEKESTSSSSASDSKRAEQALAARTASAEKEGRTERTLRLLFLASGCAALIYEVVWFHLMRLVIGASSISVGIVLASFMGGMFLGSLLFARYVPRSRNPLAVYAALEVGIGVFGLLMPLLLPALRSFYVGLVGYGALGIALRAVVAAVLLLPPTALMGATLPAVARRYSGGRRGTSALAGLYAANTIGAVLGALVSAFYLLAVWDIWVATFSAVIVNFVVGAAARRLSRTVPARAEARGPPRRPVPLPAAVAPAVYLGVALSGFTALGGQVVWTRLLTLLFGATVFAFAILLAVFLAGLGLGSALAAFLLRRGLAPIRGMAFTQLLLVPALLLAAYVIARVLPYSSPGNSIPVRALHGLHVLRAIDVILPAAVLWGMSFPFALAAVNSASRDPGRSSGLVYAANTVGAILGALFVSFWAIPAFGSRFAEQSLVVAAALSGAVLFRALRAAGGRASASRVWDIPPVWALASGLVAASALPGLSKAFLTHGRYIWWVDPRDQYVYVSEGASSTVAVHVSPDGYKNFHVAGRVESTNNPNDLRTERLIGHLSGLAHPHPRSVLVVGLGGGVSAGALTLYPEVKRIVICEIEPRVVGAANEFKAENYGVLEDPRVEIVFDDARHFLATTREKFDVITSDPIHPWVRGNSMLFSREYYEIVKARLEPGGIATQWVPLYETSELAIRIQMRTFMEAFPDGTVWNTASTGRGYDVVLVGGTGPLRLDVEAIQERLQNNPALGLSLREVKISNAIDLLGTFGTSGKDMKAWLADAPTNRDLSLKLEYISGLALNQGAADPIYSNMTAGRTFPNVTGSPASLSNLKRKLGLDVQ